LDGILTKLLACAIATGLILTAPGIGCYEALANTIGVGVKAVPVQGGASLSVGSHNTSLSGPALSSMGSLSSNGVPMLGSALPGLVAPEAGLTPSVMTQKAAAPVQAAQGRIIAAPSGVRAAGLDTAARSVQVKAFPAAVQAGALSQTQAAAKQLDSGEVRPFSILSSLFDRSAPKRGLSGASPVPGQVRSSTLNGLRRSHSVSAKEKSEPSAPGTSPVPSREDKGLWTVFGLATLGAVGAFFAAPYVVGLTGAYLPAWFAAHPVWTTALLSAAGWLAGVSLAQADLWKAWPRAVWSGASKAAKTTFRFWARFGRIFSSVLTGGSSDEAMKAPLPMNLFKYPVLAWPFVLVGYGMVPLLAAGAVLGLGWSLSWVLAGAALVFGGAPVSFAAGLVYQLVDTPVRAALRGLKRVIVGFFPWVQGVLNFLGRVIRKAIPFILGFLWGGIRAGGFGIAVGFMNFARPVFMNVVDVEYKALERRGEEKLAGFPARLAARLQQFLGLLVSGILGIVGGALGLVLSIPFIFTHAVDTALEKAEVEGRAAKALRAWRDALEREKGLAELTEFSFRSPIESEEISVGNGFIRLLNAPFQALYTIPALSLMAAVAYVRSWRRAGKDAGTDKAEKPELEPLKRAEKAESETPPVSKTGFLLPFSLALLGLGAAVAGAYFWFMPGVGVVALLAWKPLLTLGVAGLLGAGVGLALSQPKAFKGYFPAMWSLAKDASALSFRGWARLGVNTDAALKASEKDEALFRDTPSGIMKYPALARAAVLGGYLAAVAAFPAGLLFRAVSVPVQAGWLGFVSMVERFVPFLKKVIRTFWRVIREAIPFVFGLAWGAIKGLGLTAYMSAGVSARAIFLRAVDPEDAEYDAKTLPQAFAVRIVQGVAIILGVVAALLGGIVGLAYGLPFTLTMAFAQAFRWADVGGRSENFFRIWEAETLKDEVDALEAYTEPAFPARGRKLSYWDGFVRAGNLFGHAIASLLSNFVVAGAVYLRSASRAMKAALSRDPEKSKWEVETELSESLRDVPGFVESESGYSRGAIRLIFKGAADIEAALKAGRVSREMAGYRIELIAQDTGEEYFPRLRSAKGEKADDVSWEDKDAPAPVKASKGEAVAALVLGLTGLAGGVYAGWAFALPLLGLSGWLLWAGLAGAGILGAGIGMALSQPSAWKGYFGVIGRSTRDTVEATFGFWRDSGRLFAGVLLGREAGGRNVLGWGHLFLGGLLAVPWAVIGFVHGVLAVPVRAALQGGWRVLENIWPWIRKVADVLWKVAKRFFPFVFGGIAGLFVGAVGTAVFGAMLLGRPWFKYVVAPDYDTGSIGRFIGTAAIKALASIVGVVFAVIGLAMGLLAAIPYTLTFSAALAFQFADVGGRIEKFFDLWNKKALMNELRRINLLTNKFEFEESGERGIAPMDGLIRMANIFPATLAAVFAATIAGYTSYFRSMWRAGLDLRAGKEVGDDGFETDPGYTARRYARKGRKQTSRWLSRLMGFGGMLAGAGLIIRAIFWTGGIWSAIWKGVAIGVLAGPVGWVAGIILGALLGFCAGLMVWLARELDRKLPETAAAEQPPSP